MNSQYFNFKKDNPNLKEIWIFFKSTFNEFINSGGCEIAISPVKKSKTAQQRKYAHMCISIIAKEVGENPEHLKARIKHSLGLIEKIYSGGETITIEKSTEKLNRHDYSIFIESIMSIAESMNVRLPETKDYGMDEEKRRVK